MLYIQINKSGLEITENHQKLKPFKNIVLKWVMSFGPLLINDLILCSTIHIFFKAKIYISLVRTWRIQNP